MKKIFVIDWILFFAFVLSAITGVGLHLSAENGASHEVWHNWAVAHIVASLLFLYFGITHVKMHFAWYKGAFKKGLKGKSKITASISLIYTLSVFTGISLLMVEGANSGVGKWHWIIGLILIITSSLHIAKRMTSLRKSLN